MEALRGRVHKRPAGAPNAVMHAVDVAGLKSDGPFFKRLTTPAWVCKPSPEPWSTNMCSLWLLDLCAVIRLLSPTLAHTKYFRTRLVLICKNMI